VAIRDLLWACPACGALETLVRDGRAEKCRVCAARLHRGRSATLVLEAPGKPAVVRQARDWVDALGQPDDAGREVSTRVVLRDADQSWPLSARGELLGYVERFGPEIPGTLALSADTVTFAPDRGAPRVWPILDVTAVQPASSTLQLKVKGEPVVTLRFVEGSVRLWESRIQQRLRTAWRDAGRGEIVEFQPRVSSR